MVQRTRSAGLPIHYLVEMAAEYTPSMNMKPPVYGTACQGAAVYVTRNWARASCPECKKIK